MQPGLPALGEAGTRTFGIRAPPPRGLSSAQVDRLRWQASFALRNLRSATILKKATKLPRAAPPARKSGSHTRCNSCDSQGVNHPLRVRARSHTVRRAVSAITSMVMSLIIPATSLPLCGGQGLEPASTP